LPEAATKPSGRPRLCTRSCGVGEHAPQPSPTWVRHELVHQATTPFYASQGKPTGAEGQP